jgi:hypothetical protein
MVISPILSPGLIILLAGIRVCVGAFVGEICFGVGASVGEFCFGVAHAVRITTNNTMDVKQPGFFMVIILCVWVGSDQRNLYLFF